MVSYSEKNNKAGYLALLLVFSLFVVAPRAFAADSNDINDINSIIGKNTNNIEFSVSDVSKSFQIWNAGTGALHYTIDINGADAHYFTIDDASAGEDVNGQSNDVDDKKSHTVSVDYGELVNTTLNAQIVIINENNNVNVSYITLTAQSHAEPNESSSPLIGRSVGRIELAGNVISKGFQIWNNGTETMNYTLAIDGDDSDYFSLDTEESQSEGQYDKQTHTVSVEYDSDFHNNTLYAWIEITDDNDNVAYIDLSATETVVTRVSYISIEQRINYQDGVEASDFGLYIETDGTVEQVDFTTAGGEEYSIWDYNENEDDTIRYWTFPEEPPDSINLVGYGDGEYTINVTYDNDDTAQTIINFGIPNKPGTILWPTQEPVITYPELETVSPVRFEWEKCVDPNAGAVRLNLDNIVVDEIVNSIEKEYSKGTTKSSSINLDAGQWSAALGFGKWYQSENDDGIPYEVGKCTRSYNEFEIIKWFGTDDDLGIKNHPLKIADCCGAEVTFNLTGGGYGEIEDDDCAFDTIYLYDTTPKSVFTIKTAKNATTTIGNVTVDTDIKSISAPYVNLEGTISITGGARSITLNNVNGTIEIGIQDSEDEKIAPCVLKFNRIESLDLTSDTPIKKLQATEWLAGSIDTPWISTMTINGDFGAELTLSGDESPKGMTLKSAKISGEIDGEWNITDGNCGAITFASSTETSDVNILDNVGTIKAAGNKKTGLPVLLSGTWQLNSIKAIKADKGWISNAVITAGGDISSILAGGIKDSAISTEGVIGKIENKGIKDNAFCFINSDISADRIGTASIAYSKYDNGEDGPFGLTVSSIDKLTVKDSSQKTTWLDPNLSTDPITIDDFEIKPPE